MSTNILIITPLIVALIVAFVLHPKVVTVAKLKGIVDNPGARKLQKEPVPILGGVVVFFGICLSVVSVYVLCDCSSLFMVFGAMLLMLYTGTIDDITELSPIVRLLIQIFAVCLLIFSRGYSLDNLHGLWGVGSIPEMFAIPLTIFACVGIINALNLIDGVDGLSSGYCIMASSVFAVVFILGGVNLPMSILAMATIGSLIPFFLHNVFGRKSKMFIGDGGTLVMGVVMSVFVIKAIQSHGVTRLLDNEGYSSVAFTLAVLAIPVFDTVRVMSARMLRGKSPFHPDKTHLHHMFIELGCSHIATTICILSLNALIIMSWAFAGWIGLSPESQVCIVVILSLLFTSGLYITFRQLQRNWPSRFQRIIEFNKRTHPQRDGIFLVLQKLIDRL